ncbi:MAG: adenylate/guanylate cyclase domain-containing protein [Bacteriovorax sp.]|nr:adenylate/guanylate cyclase domain-containing protein [Bacteriovorax sp.]
MLFRIFQYLGIMAIVTFSAASIFLSTSARDLNSYSNQSFFVNYASFFEDRFYDLRMKLTIDRNKKDDRLVLAAIDDRSLTKIGRWPWSRTQIVKLVDKLHLYGAKVVAFDIFFSEPELACNAESPDLLLAQTLKNFQSTPGNKIILPYSVVKKENDVIDEENYFKEAPDQLLNYMMDARQAEGSNLQEYLAEKKVYPIGPLANADVGIAHIEAEADADGVFRHYPITANVSSIYLPSFALQAYEMYSGDRTVVNIPSSETAFLKTKKGNLYVNYNGESKIRWFGGLDHFPTVSVYDILTAKDSDAEKMAIFKDKLVFIGSTAFGANDLRNTPVDPILPGIVFHMNMVHMLLEGKFLVSELDSTKISWIMLISGSVAIVTTMLFGHAILDFFAVFFIMGGLFYLDSYYFIPKGYNNRLFFCLFSVLSCYSWSTFLHFYQSNKEKKKIKGTFSRYLAPSIVNDLLKNPEKVRLGGEKKNITVFFSDVRDFTSISEKLTPEQLTLCLNKYMTMMTDTLFEHNGTLDKYIGDAMVAYWGAPVDLQDHPYWAVKGAIQMIERLPAINEEFAREGFPQFKHGIGLNTGECSVGNMGSNQIFSYTALGDNMNLGARLESLCKYYGVQLNISEYTKNAIPENLAKEFTFRTLDKVKVKGKENSVTIYEVLHPNHHLINFKDDLHMYENAFQMYLDEKFTKASEVFQELHNRHPEDKSFERMLHMCQDFMAVPPLPNWDGSYTHKSK